MRQVKRVMLFSLLVLLVASCATSRQQTNMYAAHDNYIARIGRDSIFVHDSVSLISKADTVFLERVRTLYRDKVRIDTFLKRDTIYSERVATVEKPAPRIFSLRRSAVVLLLLLLLLCRLPQKLWHCLKKCK